jgi:hypothetical protein
MRILLTLLAACHPLALMAADPGAPPPDAAAADLVVAPDGRDDAAGTAAAPLATLAGARDALRRRIAAGGAGDLTVRFRGGTYQLLAPVAFGAEDCVPGHTVTYAAWPGETPVLSGGRRIDGWQRQADGVWTAAIPGAKGGAWTFRRLYVGDRHRTLARTPDAGAYFRIVDADPDAPDRAFAFAPGDLRAWPDAAEADVLVLNNWESATLPIAKIDAGSETVTLAGPIRGVPGRFEHGRRYFVENLAEALDAPGEWHLDRKTGVLSYIPLPGEDPRSLAVVAPVTTGFLRIAGADADTKAVHGLRFTGLAFRHGDFTLEPGGHSDGQAAESVPAAITLANARDCAVERCEIAGVGGYAIEVAAGCTGIRLVHDELRDLGAGGIKVRHGSSGTVIDNDFIHDGGSEFFGGTPILVQDSGGNAITHNEVCDFNWMGICVGWSWGFAPTHCHDNRIEYNHLHHLGRGETTDIGGIYTLGISTGTVIGHNLVHHVWDWEEGYLACGIYPDEGSSGLLIEDNVVYQTASGGLHVHYGRDNVVRNNVFAFGRSAQIWMGRKAEGDEAKRWGHAESSMTFERNIVLFSRGELYMRDTELHADRNLFWKVGGGAFAMRDGLDLAAWQAKGHDQHSLIADPRCADPEHGDFTLAADSPALRLGFVPIDLSAVGLSGERDWVERPKRIQRAPVTIPEAVPYGRRDSIADGFETTRAGAPPHAAQVNGAGADGWIRVTDQGAASGRHCLEVRDAPGLANPWDPHLVYSVDARQGVARAAFAVRLEGGAQFFHEWRDWTTGGSYIAGPSLWFHAGGGLEANGKPLMRLPLGQWVRIAIACPLGAQADGTYEVTVTVPGGEPTVFAKQACDRRFARLTWFGFCSMATDRQSFFLDDLSLRWK